MGVSPRKLMAGLRWETEHPQGGGSWREPTNGDAGLRGARGVPAKIRRLSHLYQLAFIVSDSRTIRLEDASRLLLASTSEQEP